MTSTRRQKTASKKPHVAILGKNPSRAEMQAFVDRLNAERDAALKSAICDPAQRMSS
jgi:hypothetical protein